MNVTMTLSGVRVVREGQVAFFHKTCDEGCSWTLSPDYRRGGWVAQHGENREAVLVFARDRLDPFDPAVMMDEIEAWVTRCHAYELPARRAAGGGAGGC